MSRTSENAFGHNSSRHSRVPVLPRDAAPAQLPRELGRDLESLRIAIESRSPSAADAAFAKAQKAVDLFDPGCAAEWSALRISLFRIWQRIRDMPERRSSRAGWN